MNSNLWVNVWLAIGSTLSFFSNLASSIYVKKTYDLSNTLYFVLFLDAVFVSLVSLSMIPLYTYMAVVGETSAVTCSLQLFGFPMLPNLLPMLGFWISLVR